MSLLTQSLLDQINREFAETEPGYEPRRLSKTALSYVKRHPWNGNVRQLHSVLVQAAVMCEGTEIKPRDLAASASEQEGSESSQLLNVELGGEFSSEKYLENIQRQLLIRAMDDADGVLVKAAALLGITNYQTLDAQLTRLGVDKSQWKRRR